MNYRPLRVAKLIQHELTALVVEEVELENAIATVTGVDVDKKLERAIVHVSVIPSSQADHALSVLRSVKSHLQYLLAKKINIKPMPHLEFRIDHGNEHAATIEKKLLENDLGYPDA